MRSGAGKLALQAPSSPPGPRAPGPPAARMIPVEQCKLQPYRNRPQPVLSQPLSAQPACYLARHVAGNPTGAMSRMSALAAGPTKTLLHFQVIGRPINHFNDQRACRVSRETNLSPTRRPSTYKGTQYCIGSITHHILHSFRRIATRLFIHSFLHLFIRSSVHPFIHPLAKCIASTPRQTS